MVNDSQHGKTQSAGSYTSGTNRWWRVTFVGLNLFLGQGESRTRVFVLHRWRDDKTSDSDRNSLSCDRFTKTI